MVLHLHTTLVVSYSAYPACCQNSKAIQANSTTQFFIEVGIELPELKWRRRRSFDFLDSQFAMPSRPSSLVSKKYYSV